MKDNINIALWKTELERLPRRTYQDKLVIDWKKVLNYKLNFDYFGIMGYVEIIDSFYKNKTRFLRIKYKNNELVISSQNFTYCKIGSLLKEELGTKFRLSEDNTYWIGITRQGDEFYFNGEYSEEIMKYNWGKNRDGYIANSKGRTLHREVMCADNPDIYIDHINNNKVDNRKDNLRLSNHIENSKNIKTINPSGVTGLIKVSKEKYRGAISVNKMRLQTQFKEYNEALIDLLIIQQYFGFKHNEDIYYKLDNIPTEYKNELILKTEKHYNKLLNSKIEIKCKNKFELSEDGTFYWVYDKFNNACKISIENLELVKQGHWYLNNKWAGNGNLNKQYFRGEILKSNKRVATDIHRHILNITDIKYKRWFVDHLNGDGLDNRRENLIITDAQGNGINKKGKNYGITDSGKYYISIVSFGKHFALTVDTEQEAIKIVEQKKKEAMNQRLEFYSKEELDTYLHNQELAQAI